MVLGLDQEVGGLLWLLLAELMMVTTQQSIFGLHPLYPYSPVEGGAEGNDLVTTYLLAQAEPSTNGSCDPCAAC